MNNGWICSYRSIWGHPFFKGNGLRVAVWHWLKREARQWTAIQRISPVELPVAEHQAFSAAALFALGIEPPDLWRHPDQPSADALLRDQSPDVQRQAIAIIETLRKAN